MSKGGKIAENFDLFHDTSRNLDKVKVLLIYPPVRLTQHPLYPPLGLLSIASVLEKAGAIVEVLDLNMERLSFSRLKKELKSREFDLVGTGGMATVYYYMKFLAEFFKKEYPDIPLIGGGTACSGSPDIVIEKTRFDMLVLGEGEPVIIDVVDALINKKDLSGIPGIIYRDIHGQVVKTDARPRMLNLGELPFPAYHLIDMDRYIMNAFLYKNQINKVMAARISSLNLVREKASRPVMIFSKRGCPYGCNFCYRNFGRKVVNLPVQYILDHMDFLEKEYNTINFVFGDEIFNIDKKWVMEFCQRIIDDERKYILNVGNGLRANVIDEEMMEKMKEAGFCSIAVGIESFYDPTLIEMNKNQSAEVISNAIRIIQKTGFHLASAQMLFGYSSDGPESMKVNVAMCKELGLRYPSFSIPCPYPGTFLYEKAVTGGYLEDEEGWLMELADKDISDRVINMSGKSEKELNRIIIRGKDEVRMYFKRKQYPFLGSILTVAQKAGRFFNFNFFGTVIAIMEGIKNLFLYRRLPASLKKIGGTSDSHIKDEVIGLLEKWSA
jgi:magnesium-protoporphyrin IX monomethyl ester (oxidative) cyclase